MPGSKILFALTSRGLLADTGRPTGVHVPDLAYAAQVFGDAGYDMDFVSVRGGAPPQQGVDRTDPVVNAFVSDAALARRLQATSKPGQVSPEEYAAIYFVGGHGAMWDFPTATGLGQLARDCYERGGIVAAVCHGPAALLNVRLTQGRYLIDGKRLTSFTNREEAAAAMRALVPFALESALVQRGAHFSQGTNFSEYAVADRRLVTGQNPASAAAVARLVLAQLPARPA